MPKKESTSLFLHFSSNALAYSIYDPSLNLFNFFAVHKNLQTQVEWDSAFSNDPLLRMNYSEVKASFTNPLFTLIPTDLYEESEYLSYLEFNINEPDHYFKSSKPIIELNAEVLFCVDRDPKIILNKYYPNSLIYHSSIPILEGILRQNRDQSQDRIYIYTWNNHDMEIIGIKNGKLAIYNHFFLTSPEEYLYYPLYICERLGFNRETVEVFIGGNQIPSSKESLALRPYFQKFTYLGIPNHYKYSTAMTLNANIGMIGSLVFLELCE